MHDLAVTLFVLDVLGAGAPRTPRTVLPSLFSVLNSDTIISIVSLFVMFIESHISLWLGESQMTDGRPTSRTPALIS